MALVLTTGFSGSTGLAAALEPELKVMSDAIQSDTEKMQHQKAVKDMERKQREIDLLNMATRMADKQTMEMSRQMDFLNGYVYICKNRNRQNCGCNTRF
jgi:hypothetical protein